MKRFVILLLVLLALTATQGAVEAAKKEACVCANGEKNCPCLAQRDPGIKLSGTVALGDSQLKVSAKPGKLKFQLGRRPVAQLPPRQLPRLPKMVKSRSIYGPIPLVFKYKTIAPAERKQLGVLKQKLHRMKGKMRQLKMVYRKAPLVERKALLVKRQVFKKSFVDMKIRIKQLKARLHMLVKQHYQNCVQKTVQRAQIVQKKIVKLTKQIRELVKKKEQLQNYIRVSSQQQSAALCVELKKVKGLLRHKNQRLAVAKKFVLKVKAVRKKATQKHLARSIRRKDRKLNHLLLKHKKLAAKIAGLKKKQRLLKSTILYEKKKVQESKLSPPQRMALKLQITRKLAKVAKLLVKRKNLLVIKHKLKKRIQPLVATVTKARKTMKKMKASSKCLGLQLKLSRELMRVKKLNAKFNKECTKAMKSKAKEDIKKALMVKIKINKVKTAISKIKGHIRRVPLLKRRELKKKEEKLLVKLHMLQVDLKKAKAKATAVRLKCEEATGNKRETLEKKRRVLIEKIVHIQKLIIDTKKTILLIKTNHKKVCEDAIALEKKKSKELILNIKNKLLLAQKQAQTLHKALLTTRNLVQLQTTADRLKQQALHTEDKALQAQLREKRTALKAKIVQLKRVETSAKLKAKRLQMELDQKSKAQLKAERAAAKIREEEIEAEMKDSIAKEEALRQALAKAHDEATIEALQKQRALELKRLNYLNVQLKESQEAQKALELEANLIKKMQLERREEAKLQRAILLKRMRKKTLKLKTDFDLKATAQKTARVNSLKGLLDRKLLALQLKLTQARRDFQIYSTALQTKNKKMIAAALLKVKIRYQKKIKALEETIKKEKESQLATKGQMLKSSTDQLLALSKKLNAESDAKILAYKKKIEAATAKGQELINAAKLKNKLALAKLQADAKKKMAGLKAQIKAIKLRYSKTEADLNQKVLLQDKRLTGLTAAIALEQTKKVQRKQAHKLWMKAHKVNVQKKLETEKSVSTKELEMVKETIKKTKESNSREEASLSGKLKSALNEVENLRKNLQIEKVNYKKLAVDQETWTANHKRKLKADVQKEVLVRQNEETQLTQRLKKCRDSIANAKAHQLKLESEIDQKSSEIAGIHELKAQQAKAKTVIVGLEGKLMASSTEVEQLRKTIDDSCSEGTEGSEAACQEFRTSLAVILQKSTDLKELLVEEREKFFKLH